MEIWKSKWECWNEENQSIKCNMELTNSLSLAKTSPHSPPAFVFAELVRVLHHLKKEKKKAWSFLGLKKKNTLLFHTRCQAFLDSLLRNRKRRKAFSLFAAYVRRIHRKLVACVVTLPQVGQILKIHTIGINTTKTFLLQKPYLFERGIWDQLFDWDDCDRKRVLWGFILF